MANRGQDPDALLIAQIAALEALERVRPLAADESARLENLLLRQYQRARRLRLKIERAGERLSLLGAVAHG